MPSRIKPLTVSFFLVTTSVGVNTPVLAGLHNSTNVPVESCHLDNTKNSNTLILPNDAFVERWVYGDERDYNRHSSEYAGYRSYTYGNLVAQAAPVAPLLLIILKEMMLLTFLMLLLNILISLLLQ
jgi:hypothetical protein